ncbi:hypothetical protein [Lutimonas vermicola]|uniref:Uncharacterized protein n=1 Tax=Lutimonas vermicola TaxID=414288 RepID=A0ABU9L4A2_9FLAO
MNKLYTFLLCTVIAITSIHAQVGVGTSSPDASSALDISSTDKGLLIPRMTTAQRTAITTPANSLMVFDTDTNSQWIYIDGAWVESKAGVGKFVDGASPDIAYYPGRVGIGLDQFSTVHKLYVRGESDLNAIRTSVKVDAFYTGSGTSVATYGFGTEVKNNGTGIIGYAIGTQGIIRNSASSGGMTNAVGSYPQIYNDGNITYGSAMIAENYNNAGTMTTGRGMDVGLINASGASIGTASLASMFATNEGAITGDGYGLFIGGTGSGSVAGNSYGLFLSTPFSNVAGTAYALYSDNVNNSYMAGNLGVGTLDPQQKVHITGVLRLEPQAVEPAGGLGDFYVNTDGTLYFHDGTSWKEVQVGP